MKRRRQFFGDSMVDRYHTYVRKNYSVCWTHNVIYQNIRTMSLQHSAVVNTHPLPSFTNRRSPLPRPRALSEDKLKHTLRSSTSAVHYYDDDGVAQARRGVYCIGATSCSTECLHQRNPLRQLWERSRYLLYVLYPSPCMCLSYLIYTERGTINRFSCKVQVVILLYVQVSIVEFIGGAL